MNSTWFVASVTCTQHVPVARNVSWNGLRTDTVAPLPDLATIGVTAGVVVGTVEAVGALVGAGTLVVTAGASAAGAGERPPRPTATSSPTTTAVAPRPATPA
jgi:hypothetical protein